MNSLALTLPLTYEEALSLRTVLCSALRYRIRNRNKTGADRLEAKRFIAIIRRLRNESISAITNL